MENIPTFYQGSSIALILRMKDAVTETELDLSQYEVDATLYTRLLGNKIRLSTSDPARIPLSLREDGALVANIPSTATSRFPVGTCTIQLILEHKTTGTKLIAATRLLTIKQSIS